MSNTSTLLLHLTDLHFGDNLSKSISLPDFSYKDIAKLISNTIRNNYSSKKIVIALGGDITNKAEQSKYRYAHDFINTIKSELNDFEINFILCPGNHDIESNHENLFRGFNTFSAELTGTENFLYSEERTSVLFEKNNWSFIITNSVYHGNHKYGLIDLRGLETILEEAKSPILLLTHHHLIPIIENDISTTRNAYDFLRLSQNYNVKVIIHGHIHSSFKMEIAKGKSKFDIIGCGATLPEISTNYSNQFNIIELIDNTSYEIFSHRIIYDSVESFKPQTQKTKL